MTYQWVKVPEGFEEESDAAASLTVAAARTGGGIWHYTGLYAV